MKTVMALMTISLFSLPAVASDAYGDPFEGWGFVKDDWQVVCDNTLTCRAAGYAGEDQWNTPATILLTAIPKKALPTGQIQFVSEITDKTYHDAELWLNGKNQGKLQPDAEGSVYDLTAKQTNSLISNARFNTKIEVKASGDSWVISDKGMGAVLLKLDEVQGRVGTSIALVSKNHASKQTPKSAKPTPVIKKAFAYSNKDNKQLNASRLAYFQKNISQWVGVGSERSTGSKDVIDECGLIDPNSEEAVNFARYAAELSNWDFTPIDVNHTIASHMCWRGAYNEGYGYWLIDNAKPGSPQLITTAGGSYEAGEIWAAHRDRGIGDCWSSESWSWDGKKFAKSGQFTTGMCRGFAGGAWSMPTYVSETIE